MKRGLAYSLAFLTTFVTAFGDTFYGTITQTITSTNDPQYYVGQQFTGYYSYESSSMDGTFCVPSHWYPETPTNLSLSGSLYVPFADQASFQWTPPGSSGPISYDLNFGDKGCYSTFANTPTNPGRITISGGSISEFAWSFDVGGFWMWATASEFQALSYYDRGPIYQAPKTRGSFVISNPTRVPDAAATLPLLGGALLCLGLIRRRLGK